MHSGVSSAAAPANQSPTGSPNTRLPRPRDSRRSRGDSREASSYAWDSMEERMLANVTKLPRGPINGSNIHSAAGADGWNSVDHSHPEWLMDLEISFAANAREVVATARDPLSRAIRSHGRLFQRDGARLEPHLPYRPWRMKDCSGSPPCHPRC